MTPSALLPAAEGRSALRVWRSVPSMELSEPPRPTSPPRRYWRFFSHSLHVWNCAASAATCSRLYAIGMARSMMPSSVHARQSW